MQSSFSLCRFVQSENDAGMSGFIDAVKSFVGGAVESASQPTPPPQTAQSALTGPPHLAPVAQLNEGVAANAVAQAGPVGTLYEKHHNLVERSRPPRTTSPTYSPILPAAALPFADYPAAPTPPVENSDEVDRFSLDGDFLDNDDDDDLDGEQMISNDILDEDALVRAMQEDKLREQRGPLPVTKRLFESSSEEESNDEDAEVDQLMDDDLLANQTHSRSPATNPNQGNATAGPSNQRAVAVPSTQRVVPGAPRYTVEMVRNNSKNNRHVIRLAPGVDDGRPSTWPQTLRKDQLVGGKLNWHREIQRGEPKDVGWREKIGDHLAKTLELPRSVYCPSPRRCAAR